MAAPEPPTSVKAKLEAWGNSSLAPAGLATLVAPLHLRPAQPLPLLFVPVLLFSSYANLQGFKIDSAGVTMAASGTYALLAWRRKPFGGFRSKFSVRGVVRGSAIGLGAVNALAAGWVYATGNREKEKQYRNDNPRWAE
ncbi:hypothetical protein FHL15_009680 [Xylaria flabelliformis]|uniref:Uncharacterized protein n=1 Tax=Xylaria flabelliformis TaxID=2512241 RepID=A0A553HN44_9PEZI|nr:hypothetical protein FHL15_009680 [Xylaria flabelliformis]